MQTVTVQDPSGFVFSSPEPEEAVTPAAPKVIDDLSPFGEYECEWALDRVER